MRKISHFLMALCMLAVERSASSSSSPSVPASKRNVNDLSRWASEQGVVMHESLRWKQQAANEGDDGNDDNIGVELTEPVEPGTVLLKVPRSIVFDAGRIRSELEAESPEKVGAALARLRSDGFEQHAEGFFIFAKVLRCCLEGESSAWAPYIQSLPRNFVEFSSAEKSCLPYYAKYIADYQEEKLASFCEAAFGSGLVSEAPGSSEQARFAFCAVSSRFWKTSSTEEGTAALMKGMGDSSSSPTTKQPTSELVPVGDMFNHREPPNVAIAHEGDDYVSFVYKGNTSGDEDNLDLYITYGQPSNPHRFLGVFGFVPVADMPNLWSHLVYVDNPFTENVEAMTFRTSDGHIPKQVWDAVLYALLEPKHPPGEPPEFTEEQHTKYRSYTADILKGHIEKQLEELATLKKKIQMVEAIGGSSNGNIGLVRQHNEFLSGVFEKAAKQVGGDPQEERT